MNNLTLGINIDKFSDLVNNLEVDTKNIVEIIDKLNSKIKSIDNFISADEREEFEKLYDRLIVKKNGEIIESLNEMLDFLNGVIDSYNENSILIYNQSCDSRFD